MYCIARTLHHCNSPFSLSIIGLTMPSNMPYELINEIFEKLKVQTYFLGTSQMLVCVTPLLFAVHPVLAHLQV